MEITKRGYLTLTSELIDTLRALLLEAAQGDPGARKWLCAAFPAHRNFLFDFWGLPKKGVSMNTDGQATFPPTEAQLAQSRRDNAAARAQFDAERTAAETAKTAKLEAEQEEKFKSDVRQKYRALNDADFARLWERIRDDELLLRARALAEQPRPADAMYTAF